MRFAKYHGLGNDYLVIEPGEFPGEPSPGAVRAVCRRHHGVGADGVLIGPLESSCADFGLRIFNPDGREAEKSGNGLRIFARFLWDKALVGEPPFSIQTKGGVVRARVIDGGRLVRVEMGRASFDSAEIPVLGPRREVLAEVMSFAGRELTCSAVTVGNPHCVVHCEIIGPELAVELGPHIERDPRFPNGANVQFMQVLDRATIRIEIWERGAHYTLASGSSACAVAAVARRLGRCDPQVDVEMPGGALRIAVGDDYRLLMTGPVTKVAEGVISPEVFQDGD